MKPVAPARASSGSAMSACRSPSNSPRPGFTPPASISIQRKVHAINEGRSYIPDVATADVQALTQAGKLDATTDFAIVRELDTDQHLRADAAAQDQGPRHVLHRLGGRGDCEAPAQGHADRARVHDLSRHDRRSRAADARSDRAQGGRRLLPRVLPRARRPGQPDVPDAQRAEGRRRPDAGLRASSRARCTARRSRRSCRSARPASPRW